MMILFAIFMSLLAVLFVVGSIGDIISKRQYMDSIYEVKYYYLLNVIEGNVLEPKIDSDSRNPDISVNLYDQFLVVNTKIGSKAVYHFAYDDTNNIVFEMN